MRFLLEGATPRTPGLMVVSLPGLMGIAQGLGVPLTPEILARLPELFHSATRIGPFHTVLVGRRSSPHLESLRAIATIRLVVSVQQGRVFVHGATPWTPKFVLTEWGRDKPYQLLRVVQSPRGGAASKGSGQRAAEGIHPGVRQVRNGIRVDSCSINPGLLREGVCPQSPD